MSLGQELPDVNIIGMGKTPKSNEPVIVVGAGLAGLSASLEVIRAGAKLILIDKEKDIGGNSAKASSGISGCNTKTQKDLGISDSTDKFYSDTMSAGDRLNDQALVDLLVHESADAVNFLIEHGVDLSSINLCGGHSVPRTHWLPSPKEGKPLPVGVAIIRALKARLYALKEEHPDMIDIRLNMHIVGLVTWNDFITGVRYKNDEGKIEELNGKAVILTTGGFSSDRDNETSLLREYASGIMDLPTTNGPFATGDGVKMARGMGAAVVGMEHVQVHPTAFVDPKNPAANTKFLAAEALRGKGAILLNEKGERLGNELGRRDYLTSQIYKLCSKNPSVNNLHTAYMVMNNKAAEDFGLPAFNFYAKIKGFFKEVGNADALAEHIGCEKAKLKETLNEYNGLAKQYLEGEQPKDSFGKTVFPVEFSLDEPFYVATITPAIHYTMGGLKIDRQAFVFSEFMDRNFQGLLAAGEVTGGVHGRNRLAGNSLLECVVFGRIAGKSAADVKYGHDEL
ncbi:FAD binding domain-containing protein [Ditylenchus destructor]|nr:FAD binding domain-containing protein [Ditylenchus destructor]